MLITSASNEKLKNIKKLSKSSKERNEQSLFIVEGIRMFREIPPEEIESVYVSETGAVKFEDELKAALGKDYQSRDDYYVVSDRVFSGVSDTGTPQGILALVRQKVNNLSIVLNEKCEKSEKPEKVEKSEKSEKIEKSEKLEKTEKIEKSYEVLSLEDNGLDASDNAFILIIEKLQDPGNLGTIIRTAEGAGVTGIIISSDSVDIYNPKVVRSTMGSIFRMPVYVSDDLIRDIECLKEKGITVYGAHLKGQNIYDKNFKASCAFLIGNEGNGLSEEVSKTAEELIKIPMKGKVESLNAAISTAVIAYEVLRQRM